MIENVKSRELLGSKMSTIASNGGVFAKKKTRYKIKKKRIAKKKRKIMNTLNASINQKIQLSSSEVVATDKK